MATSNDDILREFLLETHENLQLLDSDLIALEKNPEDKGTLSQVFRTLHSVKGTAGFMGLVRLQSVAHSAESLLSRLRAGELRFDPDIATALLRVVDVIREILASIESSGAEGEGDDSPLIAELDRLRLGSAASPKEEDSSEPQVPPEIESIVERRRPDAFAPIEENAPASAPIVFDAATSSTIAATELPTDSASSFEAPSGEFVEPRPSQVADSNIRVDVGLLDELMTLVGELVLARNQILQYSASLDDGAFLGTVQRLNLLTSELQANVMKTRMQPIGNVLGKFPRVVRDLAIACGKKVRLKVEGQETELDKTLIEAIRDPLTHMVRNAIDHGIESPEVRRSCGKPEEGRLQIEARHEGGKVVVEISDDGRGIDANRVREKAIAARLVTPQAAAAMSRQEALLLVFLPGFSTSDRVTEFSGRGVGMDVVRTNIEKIGGTVDLESVEGQGTKIRVKIPLTLAILPALIVVSGGERFALPQASLLELVGLDVESAARRIDRIQGTPVFRLRDSLLPLVYLNEQLKLPALAEPSHDVNIVVLQADDRPFGLVVDAIRDTEEIVVKPLQKQLKETGAFAGAAIMGDGRVALVLDVLGLAQRAGVVRGANGRAADRRELEAPQESVESEPSLCFVPREGGRMAIPLSRVARLEEFSTARIERLGPREAIQYRGGILPLVDVSRELRRLANEDRDEADELRPSNPIEASVEADTIQVVVCAVGDQNVGLVVERILDIVQERSSAPSRASRNGIAFAAILQDKVTEFLDVDAVVRDAVTDHARTFA